MKNENLSHLKGALSMLIVLIAGFTAANVGAVEPLKEGFQLWIDDDDLIDSRFLGFDFNPSTAEIELIVGGEGGRTILPPVSGRVSGEGKEKFAVYTADGTTLIVQSPTIRIWSLTYPDPGDAVNQQGGANETFYTSDFGGGSFSIPNGTAPADARGQVLDNAAFPIGFGIAATDSNTTRTFIFGLGIGVTYFNNAEGFVENAKFKFSSHDATTLAALCSKEFLRVDSNGFELESSTASVGNYLAGARSMDDEVRIIRFKEFSWGGETANCIL